MTPFRPKRRGADPVILLTVNGDGNRLAVGLQGDGRVAIIKRDVRTGLLKSFVASAEVEGEVNAVIFYEDYHVKRGKLA